MAFNLPECYVIFITEHDALGKNQPICHIDRVIKETADDFNDGSHIIYVNGSIRDDTPLGWLMHDFSCAEPDKIYYNVAADIIKYFKQTEEGMEKWQTLYGVV